MVRQAFAGQNWIDGQWLPGAGQAWERHAPGDGQLVWSGCWASRQQTQAAVAAARRALPHWSRQSLDERIGICRQFAEIVTAKSDELATLIAIENGKPLWEAKTEVAASIAKVANSVQAIHQRRWTTREPMGDFMAVTRYCPHGVMFVIGPFNFPAHVPGGHMIPALLAGNTLIFKPSEHVPATGQWLCQAWQAAGLPAGVLNLVHGASEVGQVAVDSQDVDGILFTGSQRVGTELHRQLAGQPERVLALEMGGNNPLVVHEPGDIRAAAKTIILSAFVTAGQRCTCTRRLILSGQATYDALVQELVQLLPQIRCGLPLDDPQPFMGPLIHQQAAQRLLAAQAQLGQAGASCLVAMEPLDRSPALLTPALIALGADQVVEDHEFFGPLLMVQQAADLEEAVALADRTRYGLAAGFIGRRQADFEYFVSHVRAGVINWNRQTTGASGKLPFGGVGCSGNHHPSGFHAADYCSFPIASLESDQLSEALKPVPGLEFLDAH